MEFTIAHLQFVKSTAHFNQPFKTEFNKISHILMGSEIFYPEISSQIKYNFKIHMYYVKIQRNIARTIINKIKKLKSKIIYFKTNYVFGAFFIVTAQFL